MAIQIRRASFIAIMAIPLRETDTYAYCSFPQIKTKTITLSKLRSEQQITDFNFIKHHSFIMIPNPNSGNSFIFSCNQCKSDTFSIKKNTRRKVCGKLLQIKKGMHYWMHKPKTHVFFSKEWFYLLEIWWGIYTGFYWFLIWSSKCKSIGWLNFAVVCI